VPIPGAKHRKYLDENVAAAIVQLDGVQMKLRDDALSSENVSGQRYPDWIMATIGR
jgi:aryl-alcohol dehydrogenase-like predicted oxidoreductase